MAELKIKSEYHDQKIAFKGSRNTKLGELDQDQLKTLAKIAHSNRSIKKMFDGEIPTLEELQAEEVAKKAPAKATPATPATPSANSANKPVTEPAK